MYFRKSHVCEKQTSLSHSSAEAEIISLDAGLRMDGIPALTLWDLVIEVFHSVPNKTEAPKRQLRGNPSAFVESNKHNPIPIKHTSVIPKSIDNIPSNTKNSDSNAVLYVFEDNEAVIKMIIKGRSPAMRHDSKSNRKRKICVQVATSSDEYVFLSYCDKFLRRIESDCI